VGEVHEATEHVGDEGLPWLVVEVDEAMMHVGKVVEVAALDEGMVHEGMVVDEAMWEVAVVVVVAVEVVAAVVEQSRQLLESPLLAGAEPGERVLCYSCLNAPRALQLLWLAGEARPQPLRWKSGQTSGE